MTIVVEYQRPEQVTNPQEWNHFFKRLAITRRPYAAQTEMDIHASLSDMSRSFGTIVWMWEEDRQRIDLTCSLYDGKARDCAQYYQKQMDRTDRVIIICEYLHWTNFRHTIEQALITRNEPLDPKHKWSDLKDTDIKAYIR